MPLDPPQFDLLLAMPKAELHLHLDGSIRIGTALDLARSRGVDAPSDAPAMAAALIAPERGADQAELLRAFELPIALLQDAEALARVAAELVEDKATDGVRYLEIRWGPNLHTREGLSLAEGIEAVCSGALDAGQRTGVEVRLICTAIRSHEPIENVRLAEAAGKFRDRGLTGWDLAGPEVAYPDPMLHADAFQAARDGGLRITVHAGEIGGSDPSTGRSAGAGLSAGSAQVRRALAVVPERIAHGPGAIDDLDLCRELIERGIALDLCPTSNVQAGVVPSLEAHPLARLHRAGVPVTLSTDDSTVSDITLSEEYRRAVERIGLTLPELWTIARGALDHAFADGPTIERLGSVFDAWAAGRPEIVA